MLLKLSGMVNKVKVRSNKTARRITHIKGDLSREM